MDYAILIIVCVAIVSTLLIGFRLGRNASAGRAGGQSDSAASTSLGRSIESTEEINRAVDRAISANAEAAEIVQKMRDLLDRHNSRSDDSSDS